MQGELASMFDIGKWVVLPYLVAKELLGLRMIPLVLKEERDWRPRRLENYSFSNIDFKTLPIASLYVMQYVRA